MGQFGPMYLVSYVFAFVAFVAAIVGCRGPDLFLAEKKNYQKY